MEKDKNGAFSGFSILNEDVLPNTEIGEESFTENIKANEDGLEIKEVDKLPEEDASEEGDEKEGNEENSNKSEDSNGEEEGDEENPFGAVINFLAERGTVELPEEYEKSEDGIDEVVKHTIKKGIDDYKNSKGELANKFLEYLDNGGDPANFIRQFSGPEYGKISEDDISEDEGLQRRLVADLLYSQGYTQEEAEEELNELTESKLLESKAKKSLKKLQEIDAKRKEEFQEAQKINKKLADEAKAKYVEDLKKDIDSRTDIAGFEISTKEKAEFFKYITEVDKKTGKTKLVLDAEADKDSQLKMAWLYFKKFDLEKIKKEVKKDVKKETVSGLKDALSKNFTKGNSNKANSNSKESVNNFSLFRKSIN